MAIYYNVTGSTGITKELISPSRSYNVSSLNVSNIHASNDATISLFIQDSPASGSTSTYYFVKNVVLPAKTSLLFNEERYFNYSDSFGLYMTVGGSDTVDVIINK